jgi:hypothetical protein
MAAGVITGVCAICAGFFRPAGFFHAYLFAALACLNPAIGCLLLCFIHRMTGGNWGRALWPALSAGQRLVPWVLLFSLPLFFGLKHIFPWAAINGLDEQSRLLLVRHSFYFSRPVFVARAACYAIAFLILLRFAQRGRSSPWTGPVGMILYVISAYLLGVDWVASIEPGWHSTGFPVVFMASQAVSALALAVAATVFLGPASDDLDKPALWKNLGNLLLGILMFWAYVAYGEFLVVWSGNLPDQSAWYLHRNAGGWHYLLLFLAVFQLLIPALLLLSSRTKRRTRFFGGLAAGVLACQTVYLYWLILPSFHPRGIGIPWLDALVLAALGSLALFAFLDLAVKTRKEPAHA